MKKPIATILKAQGIKGEVKLASSIDNTLILNLKTVYIEDKITSIKKIRTDGKFLYVFFDGIDDRNNAEELRGKVIYANKADIDLPCDTFFIDDILGCTVQDTNGKVLGELVDIYQNGVSADVYVLKTLNGETASFPFIKALKAQFNQDLNILVVDDKIISQIVLYEKEN